MFLTKSGCGKYTIVDIVDYKKSKAELKLMAELARGEQSAQAHGWIPDEDLTKALGLARGKIQISMPM